MSIYSPQRKAIYLSPSRLDLLRRRRDLQNRRTVKQKAPDARTTSCRSSGALIHLPRLSCASIPVYNRLAKSQKHSKRRGEAFANSYLSVDMVGITQMVTPASRIVRMPRPSRVAANKSCGERSRTIAATRARSLPPQARNESPKGDFAFVAAISVARKVRSRDLFGSENTASGWGKKSWSKSSALAPTGF